MVTYTVSPRSQCYWCCKVSSGWLMFSLGSIDENIIVIKILDITIEKVSQVEEYIRDQ